MTKLETEIEEASTRIQNRQVEINSELLTLESKITLYTKWAWGFVWSGIVIGILSVIYFICSNTENGFALNLLGDFLGGSVASLWALAGLFFIYVAFLGQKQQLLNQQLELMYSQLEVKYTRLELAGQREEMKEQNLTLRQQKFENTFFQLINLFGSIVNSLDLRNRQTKAVTTSGRECFDVFYKRLRNQLTIVVYGGASSNDDLKNATIEQTLEAYSTLYSNEKSDLSHYFRTIYHIYKFKLTSPILKIKNNTLLSLEHNFPAMSKYYFFIIAYTKMERRNSSLTLRNMQYLKILTTLLLLMKSILMNMINVLMENKTTANISYTQAGVSCFVGQESGKFKVQFFAGNSVVKSLPAYS
jgi:hypothetical protein